MLPIHDENPRRTTPVITILLIALCLLAWFALQGAGELAALGSSLCELGMIPGELTGDAAGKLVPLGEGIVCPIGAQPAWHTVLSAMFLHGDWFHLLGNLWFLWLFGDNVEDALGHVGFGVFYIVCGIAAALAQLLSDPSSAIPMVGASGAISGVMGAYIVFYPRVPVRVLTGFLLLWTIRVPAAVMLGFWFLLQLLGALPELAGTRAGVAFGAHVGGFLAGVAIALTVPRRRIARVPEAR